MSEFASSGFLFVECAPSETEVQKVVERVSISIEVLADLGFGGGIVLIEADKDCGNTKHALAEVLSRNPLLEHVLIITERGRRGEVLNTGLGLLRGQELRHVFTVGSEWSEFLSEKNLKRLLFALEHGSAVASLAIRDTYTPEFSDEFYKAAKDGRVTTRQVAAWCLDELNVAGNFPSINVAEEIRPLIRLIRVYGPCVSVFLPETQVQRRRFRGDPKARVKLTVAQARETLLARESFHIFSHGMIDPPPF